MTFPPCGLHPLLAHVLKPVLDKWTVPLNSHPLRPTPNTDDFENPIKSLLIAPEYCQNGINFLHTPRNLSLICKQLGIGLYPAERFYFVRDHFIRLVDGSIATAKASDKLETAAIYTHSSNLYLHRSAATHTKNQLFNSWSGHSKYPGWTGKLPNDAPLLKPLDFAYVEGGNMFTLTNDKETTKICLGSDHFWQTLLILEQEDRSWNELASLVSQKSWDEQIAQYSKELTPTEIVELAEEMFATGMALFKGKSGVIHPKVQLPLLMMRCFNPTPIPRGDEGKVWFRKIAAEASAIPKFILQQEEIEPLRTIVGTYVAKKKIVHALIAKDLRISQNDLHIIPQANYHLDTFITPGPSHSIFLTDYSFIFELLSAIKISSEDLNLTAADLLLLDRYMDTANQLHEELSPLLIAAATELQKAGLRVIPAPNSLIYQPRDPRLEFPISLSPLSINFANAITGYSAITGKYFYITHGMQAGISIGNLFMQMFAQFLNHYIPDIETYFIGCNENNEFIEAMEWWNRLETQSGIHCASWKLE